MKRKLKVGKAILDIKDVGFSSSGVLAIKKNINWSGSDYERLSKQIQEALPAGTNVLILFVDNLSEVRTLNEEQMRRHGWIRDKEE